MISNQLLGYTVPTALPSGYSLPTGYNSFMVEMDSQQFQELQIWQYLTIRFNDNTI